MARARNIKPAFFKNEDLAECSPCARLCFVGLWTLADREGRLEDRPKRIKAELFAFDSTEVEPLLVELEARGFIHRYRVGGLGVIHVVKFNLHQNPHHREGPSTLPPPPQSPGLAAHAMPSMPQAGPGLDDDETPKHEGKAGLIPDSGFLIPDSRIGNSEATASGATQLALCRLPREVSAPGLPSGKPAAKTSKTAAVWRAYGSAYVKRYGVEPVRNARANGQLAHLVGRLGEDAAAVAGYFVGHDGAHYVKLAHSVGCLLADAEKLHMEWSSGRTVPDTKVTEAKGRQPRSFAGTDYSAGVTDGHA